MEEEGSLGMYKTVTNDTESSTCVWLPIIVLFTYIPVPTVAFIAIASLILQTTIQVHMSNYSTVLLIIYICEYS